MSLGAALLFTVGVVVGFAVSGLTISRGSATPPDDGLVGGEQPRVCRHAFLDLGANKGMGIRAFLGQETGRASPSGELGLFLAQQNWNVKNFCIFAFEGNPIFTERLRAVEKEVRSAGYMIEVFTETIVSAKDGKAVLNLDIDEAKNFWGSSIMDRVSAREQHWKKIEVDSVRLSRFIRERVDPGGILFIKMDIEGAEYKILPDLLAEGMLCPGPSGSQYVDYLNMEFHCQKLEGRLDNDADALRADEQCFVDEYWKYLLAKCNVHVGTATD